MPAATVGRPLVLFMNRAAGSGEGDKLLEIWEELVPGALTGPVFQVQDKSEYDQQLKQAITFCKTTDAALVVAGGDGTVNSVLSRPEARDIVLGLIPTGTFNYFARSHGIPEDPAEAVALLLTAEPQSLPLAFVNDNPFIVSVSIGLHPTVIAEREIHTRYLGRSRFGAWLSGIWTIVRSRHVTRARIRTNRWRKKIKTPLLMVNFNSAQLLGLDYRFQYQPYRFALLRLRPSSYWGLVAFILRGLSGHILDEGSLECDYVDQLEIDTQRRRERVALDGELLEFESPLRFEIKKQAFTCLLRGRAA